MVSYRLIDDRDGTVLAERASAAEALRLFGRLRLDPQVLARVTLVWPGPAGSSDPDEVDR